MCRTKVGRNAGRRRGASAGASAGAEELRDWINARVAARYQRLSAVVLMNDFPRSAAGKVLKRELREPYWKGRERAI